LAKAGAAAAVDLSSLQCLDVDAWCREYDICASGAWLAKASVNAAKLVDGNGAERVSARMSEMLQ
jgi:hypothetical protein